MLLRRHAATGVPPPPFATVVTELMACHPTWFHARVDACFVPTEDVAAQALDAGLALRQIVMHGLPIRPAFAAPLPPRGALRKHLGLAPDGAVVLLVGGGEGMGALEDTAAALDARLPPDAHVIIVCGRNAALAEKLRAAPWRLRVVVNGFVSNMEEWMGAADVVITKAGPGTIAEALIRGVPLMLNGAIPCQEEGNVPFVVEVCAVCCARDALLRARVFAWHPADVATYRPGGDRARGRGERGARHAGSTRHGFEPALSAGARPNARRVWQRG